jgi:hypothetical protein
MCLPPFMHETVGAGNHMTAAAMVKATDALWDARGSNDPTIAAATTQRSRSPAPNSGRRGDNGAVTPASKVAPPPAQISTLFRTLAMACANFIITTSTRLTGVLHPVLGQKTSLLPHHFRFGGQSSTCNCHGYALSSQCRTNFYHARIYQ